MKSYIGIIWYYSTDIVLQTRPVNIEFLNRLENFSICMLEYQHPFSLQLFKGIMKKSKTQPATTAQADIRKGT